MKNTKKAESLVAVMVVVVILSFTALWIFSILNVDKEMSWKFSGNINSSLLKSNADNIAKKLSIQHIWENEEFFLHKNTASWTYEIFTGSANVKYKFVNNKWDMIEDSDNISTRYKRSFFKKVNILENYETVEVKVE